MAGFYLWHNSAKCDPDQVMTQFESLDYGKGKFIHYGDWNIIIYPKKNYSIDNWKIFPGGIICAVGTFSYKNSFYDSALEAIFHDVKHNCIRSTKFWGTFIIIVVTSNGNYLIRDGAGLTRLYRHREDKIYSSSFAGLISCSDQYFSFDRDAATELLTTGVLTGDQTLLREVNRIITGEVIDGFQKIETYPENLPEPLNRNQALDQQLNVTGAYFRGIITDWFNYMPDSVLDIGITGGMDSRLLLSMVMDHTQRITLHTHWRKEGMKNDDFRYAHIFARETSLTLNTREVRTPFEMDEQDIQTNFERAYCLSDGVIRSGCYWDEEYSTANYRSELSAPPYLRLLGFGGEQYRNRERLPLNSSRSLKSWIRWEMLYQFAGGYFISKEAEENIINRIELNLTSQFNDSIIYLNLYNYKKYIRLIQSPSYRSLQSTMENRLGFCLSPFLDINLSDPAFLAIPFLGRALSFQLEMLNRISPVIASLPNGYGFDFSRGEPACLRAGAVFWQNMPAYLKYPLYARLKNYYRTDYIEQLAGKHKFIRDLEEIVADLDLPIDLRKHRLVRSRARLLLNLGYFIKRNSDKINL